MSKQATSLIQPTILDVGKEYLMRIHIGSEKDEYLPVYFVNYDNCPANIFVQEKDTRRVIRCFRDDLLKEEV